MGKNRKNRHNAMAIRMKAIMQMFPDFDPSEGMVKAEKCNNKDVPKKRLRSSTSNYSNDKSLAAKIIKSEDSNFQIVESSEIKIKDEVVDAHENPVENYIWCDYCGLGSAPNEHVDHISTHVAEVVTKDNDKIFLCSLCDEYGSVNYDTVIQHMNFNHKRRNIATDSTIAENVSSAAPSLEITYEDLVRQIMCMYCGLTMRKPGKLAHERSHLRPTWMGRIPGYTCDICSVFLLCQPNTSDVPPPRIMVHLNTHIMDNRFQCIQCSMVFDKRDQLDVHSLLHSVDENNGTKIVPETLFVGYPVIQPQVHNVSPGIVPNNLILIKCVDEKAVPEYKIIPLRNQYKILPSDCPQEVQNSLAIENVAEDAIPDCEIIPLGRQYKRQRKPMVNNSVSTGLLADETAPDCEIIPIDSKSKILQVDEAMDSDPLEISFAKEGNKFQVLEDDCTDETTVCKIIGVTSLKESVKVDGLK